MIKLGLIGYPLSHSLSPVIHASALQYCGLEGSYFLFPVPPDDKQGLKELLDRVRRSDMTGLNVTIPHKQNVIELLDELTPTAQAIGAVNTIFTRDNRLIGDNTDAPGFLTDLKRAFQNPSILFPPSALVLGAGGSARAVIYALLNDGWDVTIAARRMEQAQQLMKSLIHYKLQITDLSFSNIDVSYVSLVINTTPVGMTPNLHQSPWPENLSFPPRAAIYDLVYNPRETRLVREARAQGRPATTGLGMLIEQAALAFETWTGHRPSRENMQAAVEQSPVSSH